MSTKHTSTTSNNYNPASLGVFNSLQGPIQANLSADMNPDVTKSPIFALQLAQSLKAANQLGGKYMDSVLARNQQSGFGENSPFAQAQADKASRFGSGLNAQAYIQNLMMADARRREAVRMGMGYQPLVTGQTGVSKTSGTGTWLPQAISAGAAFALPFAIPGASAPMIAGGATGMTPPYLPSSAPTSWGGTNPFSGINLAPNTNVVWGGSGGATAPSYGNPFITPFH